MFAIFLDGSLIGHSFLESRDQPMGVAFGKFLPTESFALIRDRMLPMQDHAGSLIPSARHLVLGLTARTTRGIQLVCSGGVAIAGLEDSGELADLEVSCFGIEHPPYDDLFPSSIKGTNDLGRHKFSSVGSPPCAAMLTVTTRSVAKRAR